MLAMYYLNYEAAFQGEYLSCLMLPISSKWIAAGPALQVVRGLILAAALFPFREVIFRSKQGPNEVWNIIPACAGCHGCIHAGVLDVFRDSLGHVYWRSRADRIDVILEEELKELAAVPSVVIALPCAAPAAQAGGGSGVVAKAPESGAPATPAIEKESECAVEALRNLGYKAPEARERVVRALGLLATLGRAPTGDEIVGTALRGRRARKSSRPTASPGEKFRNAENPAGGDGRTPEGGQGPAGEPRPPVAG